MNNEFYDFVASCGKFNAYENKYYLPIAYCVSDEMVNFNYDYSSPFDVQNDFWYYATGMTDALKAIDVSTYSVENIDDNGIDFYQDSFSYSKFSLS